MANRKSLFKPVVVLAGTLTMLAYAAAVFNKDSFGPLFKIILLALPILSLAINIYYISRNKKVASDELKNKIKAETAVYTQMINFYLLLFLAILFSLYKLVLPPEFIIVCYLCVYQAIIIITGMLVESKYL